MEAGGGIEPPVGDLQSPALPFCYPANRLSPTQAMTAVEARVAQPCHVVFYREARKRSTTPVRTAQAQGFRRMRPDADCRVASSPL